MATITERTVTSWEQLLEAREAFDQGWLFRGQRFDRLPRSSLERACELFEVPEEAIPAIERRMIREFRRRYCGPRRDLIYSDTLYCLAVMQHHGAPTRLLDFTYSFYISVYFAIEPDADRPEEAGATLWCVNGRWCQSMAERVAGRKVVEARDRERDEATFRDLYMREPALPFVLPENPFALNQRLIIQQGIFVCPGDVTIPFERNLAMEGWEDPGAVVKLRLRFDRQTMRHALIELAHMNIDRASLFPGMDGFARSLKLRIPLYLRIREAWDEAGDAASDAGEGTT